MPGSLLRYCFSLRHGFGAQGDFSKTFVENRLRLLRVSLWQEIERPVRIVYFVDRLRCGSIFWLPRLKQSSFPATRLGLCLTRPQTSRQRFASRAIRRVRHDVLLRNGFRLFPASCPNHGLLLNCRSIAHLGLFGVFCSHVRRHQNLQRCGNIRELVGFYENERENSNL